MAIKYALTVEVARELLEYNPETGTLTWKPRGQKWFTYKDFHIHWNSRWAGKTVGTLSKHGYLVFNVRNKLHTAHRTAWMLFHGEEPPGVIDHKNGDPTDNRISNLRCTSQKVNVENQRDKSRGKALPLGVFPVMGSKTGKMFARIIVSGQRKYLGTFENPEDAAQAYLKAKRELHEGCTI